MSIEAIIVSVIAIVVVGLIAYSRKGRKPGNGSVRPGGDDRAEK